MNDWCLTLRRMFCFHFKRFSNDFPTPWLKMKTPEWAKSQKRVSVFFMLVTAEITADDFVQMNTTYIRAADSLCNSLSVVIFLSPKLSLHLPAVVYRRTHCRRITAFLNIYKPFIVILNDRKLHQNSLTFSQ